MNKKRNIIMNGIGSTAGGTVDLAKIEGIGRVDGDIDCTDLVVNGKADIRGSVKAATVQINGTTAAAGNMQADKISIQGKMAVDGDMRSDTIQVVGDVTVKGNCETEKFTANGRLQIGSLNAGQVQITLHGMSRIGEIGGEHIRIRKEPGIDFARWLKALPLPLGNRLVADAIEGDDVYVEYTNAAVVRGGNVTIGPGCEIGLVEYKAKLTQDKNAKIASLNHI